jgi:hypothetical protein
MILLKKNMGNKQIKAYQDIIKDLTVTVESQTDAKTQAEIERNTAVAEKDHVVAEKELAIAKRGLAVAEKEKAIIEKEAAVAEKQAAVDAAVSEKEAAVAEKQAAVDAAVSEKEAAIAEKEAAVAEKQAAVDAAVSEKETAIAEKEALIAEKKAAVTEHHWYSNIGLTPYILECENGQYITKVFTVTEPWLENIGIMTSGDPNMIKWMINPADVPNQNDHWHRKNASEFGGDGFNYVTYKSDVDIHSLFDSDSNGRITFPNDDSGKPMKLTGFRAVVGRYSKNNQILPYFASLEFKLNGPTPKPLSLTPVTFITYTKYTNQPGTHPEVIKAVSEEAIADGVGSNIYWQLVDGTYYFGKQNEIKFYAESSDINENFPLFIEYLSSD